MKHSPLHSVASRTPRQGLLAGGGKAGDRAVTCLTASTGSGTALLLERFSTAEGLARCSNAVPSMSAKLSFVITSADSLASLLKKKRLLSEISGARCSLKAAFC